MAKNIYHEHTSSNSYWDSSWTDKDWMLCETEQEYQEMVQRYRKKAEDYQNSPNAETYGKGRIRCSEEKPLHAQEYYYAHEWQGKTFDCIGVCYEEHLERSNHYTYIIKPGSVSAIKPCTDPGIGWMYGS